MNTRIAPSPTGSFHLGTARTAYFNYLAARSTGGKFLLRIDDTDASRNKPEFVQIIYDSMAWLGLDFDKSFNQSDFKYDDCANILLLQNKARLVDGAIVLNYNNKMPDHWVDSISGKIVISDTAKDQINSTVLLKSDGFPTYHFASVLNDKDCKIDWIIRGTDHISNTAKHVAIYYALNAKLPTFTHVGLIHKNKKKMSKRDNDTDLLYYRNKGYHPKAILNFLLRLGWGPTVDDKTTATLNKDKAIEMFISGGKMKNSSANFDQMKLDSFDRKYKAMDEKAL